MAASLVHQLSKKFRSADDRCSLTNASLPGRLRISGAVPFRLAPQRREGSGAPTGASNCRLRGARLARRARLSALHWWLSPAARMGRIWLSPGPRFLGRGIGASPSPAGSLQTGRSTGRAGSRSRPGAVRARHGARAPHQTPGLAPQGHRRGLAGRICGPEAASPAPTQADARTSPASANMTGLRRHFRRSAPPQDAS